MYSKLLNILKKEGSSEKLALFGLVVFSFILRLKALNPPALWYDDLWVGLIAKVHTLNDFFLVKAVSPPLFALFQFAAVKFVPDREVAVQIFPLLFGLVQIPLFYFLIKKITNNKSMSFLGAMILAVSAHELLVYSTRAKHYSFDSLAAMLLLFFYVKFFEKKIDLKHLLLFLSLSLVLFFGSFISIVASGILAHILFFRVVSYFWKNKKKRLILPRIKKLASIAVFDLIIALAYLKLLRGSVDADVFEYWGNSFINIHRPFAEVLNEIISKLDFFVMAPFGSLWQFFSGKNMESVFLIFIFAILVFGAIYLYKNKLFEILFFIGAFYLAAVVLASLKLYPFSGGRVDIYSYPITVFLAVCGVWQMMVSFKLNRFFRKALFAYLYSVLLVFSLYYFSEMQYPYQTNIKKYVDIIEQNVSEKDMILLAPYADYAFAYYTRWPITYQKYPTATGFIPIIQKDNVFALPSVGVFGVDAPSIKKRMEYFLARAGNFEKIYFFSSHCFDEDQKYKNFVYREYIEKKILEDNFSLMFSTTVENTCFLKIYQRGILE